MKTALMMAGVLLAAPVWADDAARDMTGKQELAMEHCPSAVRGATTKVSDIGDGVEVTVAAPNDAAAQAEIRHRVQEQLEMADAPERGAIEHTGLGTGSGRYGFCPGMLAGTTLDVRWLPDGAVMTIRADKTDAVKRLQKSTHKRAKALAARMHRVASR